MNVRIPDCTDISNHKVGVVSKRVGSKLIDIIGRECLGEITTIPLPWTRINRLIGDGLRMGQVTILAGVVGSGKTHAALGIALHAIKQNITWQYLPLEDRAESALRHAIAIERNDWSFLSENQKDAMDRLACLQDNQELIAKLTNGICENPHRPISDGLGGYSIIAPHYESVVNWVNEKSIDTQLLIIDPLSMMEYTNYDNSQQWKGQQEFIKKIVGVSAERQCHILLVAHLAKDRMRPGRPLNLDDIEGSSGYSRFAHNVLLLDRHDETNHEVWNDILVQTETVSHKRTVTVGKARNGPGTGVRIALDFDNNGPKFIEYGVIKPNKK